MMRCSESACIVCGGSPAQTDTLGIPWCDEHANRRRLMNAGASKRFPHVRGTRYAVAPGILHWCLTAVYGTETCVQDVLKQTDEVA